MTRRRLSGPTGQPGRQDAPSSGTVTGVPASSRFSSASPSFDGQSIGISHHAKDAGGKSVIYTLPAAGGQFAVTNIITGTTTVAETAVPGWTATLACDNGATGTNTATFNLTHGQDVVCTFTNTQDAPPSGDLTITKVVVGTPPGAGSGRTWSARASRATSPSWSTRS